MSPLRHPLPPILQYREDNDQPERPYQFEFEHKDRTWRGWVGPVDLDIHITDIFSQRVRTESKVARIIEEYFPPAVVMVFGVLPDGRTISVGGNHCGTATKMLGHKTFPVGIYWEVESDQDLNLLARCLLDCAEPTPADQFVLDIRCGNAAKAAHRQTLALVGRSCDPGRRTWNNFRTTKATEFIQELCDEEGLCQQLMFAEECWRGQDGVSTSKVVYAVCYLFTQYQTKDGVFPYDKLVETLKGTKLKERKLPGKARGGGLIRAAIDGGYCRNCMTDDGIGEGLASYLRDYYNSTSPTRKLYHIKELQ
jgi:hypothetical protein